LSLCELAKCRRVVTAVLAVAACAGLAGAAHAHPHVWATVRSEIILNADHQITGVRHSWTFDEFYSAMAVQGLDTNGDGVFSEEELKPLAEGSTSTRSRTSTISPSSISATATISR
jgi:ABC-type uncharacterized transport system substrate-binding protein